MSLESQLHEEADRVFDSAYYDMFEVFTNNFYKLMGIQLRSSHPPAPTSCAVFRDFVRLPMLETSASSELKQAMRKIYREKYIAAFLEANKAARRHDTKPPLTARERFWARIESLLRRGS